MARSFRKRRPSRKRRRKTSRKSVRAICKRVIRSTAEKKFVNDGLNPAGVDFNGTLWNINPPIVGTSAITRIGDSVNAHMLEVRGTWLVGSTTNQVRFMVIKWRPDNATDVPLAQDFFPLVGAPAAPLSNRNPSVITSRFQVLADRTMTLHQANPIRDFSLRIYLKHKMKFNTGLQTGKGMLYIVAVSDDGVIPHPSFSWFSKLTYTDE